MIDALLFAVRDNIRDAGWGYDAATCEITGEDGRPSARCGDVFLAVHQGPTSSEMDNALDEYFDFLLTLTMRVKVSLDRIGERLLASNLARRPGPNKQPSFNARCEQLRAVHHMGWGIIQDANTNLVAWETAGATPGPVAGFCEPARYRGQEVPRLVGGEWFWADPDARDVGLVGSLRFEGARRLHPLAMFV